MPMIIFIEADCLKIGKVLNVRTISCDKKNTNIYIADKN
jgi:hypothetical protein